LRPASPYAASKVAAEQLLDFYARTGAAGAIILRFFNIADAVDGIIDPTAAASSLVSCTPPPPASLYR
jgi:nucleoside-diphosphate-sugar epimerase